MKYFVESRNLGTFGTELFINNEWIEFDSSIYSLLFFVIESPQGSLWFYKATMQIVASKEPVQNTTVMDEDPLLAQLRSLGFRGKEVINFYETGQSSGELVATHPFGHRIVLASICNMRNREEQFYSLEFFREYLINLYPDGYETTTTWDMPRGEVFVEGFLHFL